MKKKLVAHRGDMTTYPENSLSALRAAAELGFTYLELDIQLSKDLKPIVIHDENIVRTTGIDKYVYAATANELSSHQVLSPLQDNTSKDILNIVRLKEVVTLLNNYPDVTLFVEIKRQSIEHFDLHAVMDATIKDLESARFNIVIISFMQEVIEYIQRKDGYATGWALREYDQVHQDIANTMQPNYLFCNINKIKILPTLWQGSWEWVLYDIKNPTFAYELLELGVDLIETGDIVTLSSSEYFQ